MISLKNNLDSELWNAILNIVELEHRPFTYKDIIERGVKIANGKFRNKISELVKIGKVEVVTYSPSGILYFAKCKF